MGTTTVDYTLISENSVTVDGFYGEAFCRDVNIISVFDILKVDFVMMSS